MRSTPTIALTRWLLSASIAVSLGLGGCAPAKGEPQADKVQHTAMRVPVETQTVTRKTFVRRLLLPGQFSAAQTVKLAIEMPGRVLSLPVKEGGAVRRDQVLLKLDASTVRAQAGQAKARLAQAKAQHELARATLKRMRKLAAAKIIDAAKLEQVQIGERQAAAAVKLAQAAAELVAATLHKTVIRAPISGILTTRGVEPGEVASPGRPLLVISDLTRVKLIVQVPEKTVAQVRVGQEVTVRVAALNGETLKGKVSRVPMIGHTGSRTFGIEVEIANPEGRLRAGMSGTAELVLERLPNQVVVPLDGLVDEPPNGKKPGRTVVFVAENGVAHRQTVKSGSMQGDEATVRSGLNGGEQLIIVGQRRVVDGDLISVIERNRDSHRPKNPPQNPTNLPPAEKQAEAQASPGTEAAPATEATAQLPKPSKQAALAQ